LFISMRPAHAESMRGHVGAGSVARPGPQSLSGADRTDWTVKSPSRAQDAATHGWLHKQKGVDTFSFRTPKTSAVASSLMAFPAGYW